MSTLFELNGKASHLLLHSSKTKKGKKYSLMTIMEASEVAFMFSSLAHCYTLVLVPRHLSRKDPPPELHP